ncbi:MAG: hypothetical protein Q9175_006223, partial [Cornicularia normoerica]
ILLAPCTRSTNRISRSKNPCFLPHASSPSISARQTFQCMSGPAFNVAIATDCKVQVMRDRVVPRPPVCVDVLLDRRDGGADAFAGVIVEDRAADVGGDYWKVGVTYIVSEGYARQRVEAGGGSVMGG